eukprot:gnl/TRDRNA2_/TRDRNA2_173683_c4_seq2.p2 gnl/TRDRNA2_/TRDRNA2_173683_c4~~gnl/TRDRNA2_/TRDRNA2_173683_c4_seq2.p2  ORF type:complete len:105 (+),score=16.33 gnl/TRDRNA2_/TRDRNA2_173683_c4_seq2:174-488(+)
MLGTTGMLDVEAELKNFQMAMESLTSAGLVVSGFELLVRAEAVGLLSHSTSGSYPIFRTLLEACRTVGDSHGASAVQAEVERLGILAHLPAAKTSLCDSTMHAS